VPDLYDGPETQTLAQKVEASVAAVWTRFVGARPLDARTEHDGNVFRMTMPNGTEQFAKGIAREDDGVSDATPRTAARYEFAAARAVSKVTHRKVDAMISKHNTKTGVATEVFILEELPKKY
jgi:hypothetical protein